MSHLLLAEREIAPSYWDYCGGGILCAGGSGPLISENIVTGNASPYGAGIGCHYSDPTVIRNVIELNIAEKRGAGLFSYHGNALVEGNVIANCTCVAWGGGLDVHWDSLTITGNTIIGNVGGLGGGILASDYYGLIEGNYIAHNSAFDGGGIWARWSDPDIRHNIIERNVASADGGGIYCAGGLIQGNNISYNIAGVGGGIVAQFGGSTIVENSIRGNIGEWEAGGIWVAGHTSETTIIANNLIVENSCLPGGLGYGGGIVAGPALIVNNTISHNDAQYGGGIFCWVYPYPEFLVITSNIISSNLGGYGICNDSTFLYCVPDLYYNDVWDNGINYHACLPGHGDISVDPEFAEPEWGHYSLLPSSPCLDVGDPTLLDPDGTRSNMGAFGGPDAKRVHLTFVPEADTVPGGGMLTYEAILSNNFADPLTTFGLTELLMLSGFPWPLNPLVGPMRLSLGPYQTVHKMISHYVPPAAPEGEYWYTGKVGFPPDVLEDLDVFSFQVVH